MLLHHEVTKHCDFYLASRLSWWLWWYRGHVGDTPLTYWSATCDRTEGDLQPTVHKELSPSVEELARSWILPIGSTEWAWKKIHPQSSLWDENAALANTLIAAFWELLSWRVQLSHDRSPDPQKLWDNKCVLL